MKLLHMKDVDTKWLYSKHKHILFNTEPGLQEIPYPLMLGTMIIFNEHNQNKSAFKTLTHFPISIQYKYPISNFIICTLFYEQSSTKKNSSKHMAIFLQAFLQDFHYL